MKPYLLLLATVVALSISYYIVVALPANNRAHLDFEKEKFRNEQAEMKAKKLAQEQETETKRQNANVQARMLSACLDSADQKYNHGLAINGPETGPGVYSVESRIVTMLSKQRSEAISECHKEFGPTLDWITAALGHVFRPHRFSDYQVPRMTQRYDKKSMLRVGRSGLETLVCQL